MDWLNSLLLSNQVLRIINDVNQNLDLQNVVKLKKIAFILEMFQAIFIIVQMIMTDYRYNNQDLDGYTEQKRLKEVDDDGHFLKYKDTCYLATKELTDIQFKENACCSCSDTNDVSPLLDANIVCGVLVILLGFIQLALKNYKSCYLAFGTFQTLLSLLYGHYSSQNIPSSLCIRCIPIFCLCLICMLFRGDRINYLGCYVGVLYFFLACLDLGIFFAFLNDIVGSIGYACAFLSKFGEGQFLYKEMREYFRQRDERAVRPNP